MAVQWCLSGAPRKIRDQVKREAFLTEELIIKREAERARNKLNVYNLPVSDQHNNLRKRNTFSDSSEE